MADALQKLAESGVSIWFDDLSRDRLVTGNLAALVESSGVVGVTDVADHGERRGDTVTGSYDQARARLEKFNDSWSDLLVAVGTELAA